jgi:SAM-dependent methyltransferase
MSSTANDGWKDPYYHYRLKQRKIVVDVTGSIPNFIGEIDGLSDVAAEFKKRGFTRVLDFGAGKLRNARYLLRKQFKVWAVEFKEAYDTPKAEQIFKSTRNSFTNFFFLEYPDKFLEFKGEFDCVLLINVVNVVPEPGDRKKIVIECTKRLKRGGLLLWMTQYGEPHYRPGVTKRLSLNRGWCYNLHKRYQTFNIEFKIPDIMELIPSQYYKELRKVTAAHHRAFLFERT